MTQKFWFITGASRGFGREWAIAALERGETNPLSQLLSDDERIIRYMDPAEVRSQLDPSTHVGDAPARARRLAQRVRATIGK